jgi:tetratricopeptide (TPR) repeat protein
MTEQFEGKVVVFASNLLLLSREEAVHLAESAGARVQSRLSRKVDFLVIGLDGWPLQANGAPSAILRRANELLNEGKRLKVIGEREFLRSLGAGQLLERHRYHYTLSQISRIVDTAPERLRGWVRRGFLKPIRIVNRLPWFDFTALSCARKLKDLSEAGVPPGKIEKALAALAALAPLARIEPMCAIPVLRREDGSLVEPSGQIMLDFVQPQAAAAQTARLLPFDRGSRGESLDESPGGPEGWFEAGVRAEDDERWEQAAGAYRRALEIGGPDAETCFNLGNVLLRLGRQAEAIQSYVQTVELEPRWVEAWNNVGIALGAIGRLEESIESLRVAVDIEPHYGEAHYNLAETLEQAGRPAEARQHWLAYLSEDPDSELAREVRRRLDSPSP